jgi:hypothetical protein
MKHLPISGLQALCLICIFLGSVPQLAATGSLAPFQYHYCFSGYTNFRDSVHSPKKAAILSACLPGAGQFYNRKYWKMPLIYAAGSVGGYMIAYNHGKYSSFRKAYIWRNDDDSLTIDNFPQYDGEQLKVFRDSYRRNMELSVILTTAIYLLQILDATVDGHFFDFKVSQDMVLRFDPFIRPSALAFSKSPVLGASFTLSFNH